MSLFFISTTFSDQLKKRTLFVSLLAICSSILELLTLGIILPFISFLVDNDSYTPHSKSCIVDFCFEKFYFGIPFLYFAAISISSACLIACYLRILSLKSSSNLLVTISSYLHSLLYKKMLSQPYSYHMNLNSSKMISALTKQLGGVITSFDCILQIISSAVVSFGVVISLAVINPSLSAISILFFSSIYLFIIKSTNSRVRSNGKKASLYGIKIVQGLHESIKSIKEIILEDNKSIFVNSLESPYRSRQILLSENNVIRRYPKIILESCTISFLVFVLTILIKNDSASSLLPVFGFFTISSIKLIPALQSIFFNLSAINSNQSNIRIISEFLELPSNASEKHYVKPISTPIQIQLKSISYAYPGRSSNTINDLSISFKSGDIVGIVGKTGSGKSTFLNILLGLLYPNSGEILLNEEPVFFSEDSPTLKRLRSSISHVPQSIYLLDSSIKENIAFGQNIDDIDNSSLKEAAYMSEILNFIESLPEKFDALVGEEGSMLSGGQRQRIGIARALYKNRPVLILDEATSALDPFTEEKLIKSVCSHNADMLIFIITHRPANLVMCNRYITVSSGGIIEVNTPEEAGLILNSN